VWPDLLDRIPVKKSLLFTTRPLPLLASRWVEDSSLKDFEACTSFPGPRQFDQTAAIEMHDILLGADPHALDPVALVCVAPDSRSRLEDSPFALDFSLFGGHSDLLDGLVS
jgi:hypothetical protein